MSAKNISTEMQYWNNFYSKKEFDIPSQFCALLASETSTNVPIIEFGCGNGRDALFLARHGYKVVALDLSDEAINNNNSKSVDIQNLSFKQGDVSVFEDVNTPIKQLKEANKDQSIIVYTRFFLHTLDDKQEKIFLSSLSQSLKEKDHLYFEFRTKEDENIDKIYGDHYRRYIDTEKLLTSLSKVYGFEILYEITGQGMAKYNSEDPFVSRIIAKKVHQS